MTEKEKSILEQFREKYTGCLEGEVVGIAAENGVDDLATSCSIRQTEANKDSKPKITLLDIPKHLHIPSVGLTSGQRVYFFATKTIGSSLYCGDLVALLNCDTGIRYDPKISLRQEHFSNALKWEDVQEPL